MLTALAGLEAADHTGGVPLTPPVSGSGAAESRPSDHTRPGPVKEAALLRMAAPWPPD